MRNSLLPLALALVATSMATAGGSAGAQEPRTAVQDTMKRWSEGQQPWVERPLIQGREAVIASLHPLSTAAGMRILMQGGNAFDAAVATAVATTVVDPKNSTIGGNGFATVYVAETGEVRALNFYGPAPKAATRERLEGEDYMIGYLSAAIPSNLKGYQALLEEYGTMSWAEVLAPAIELAEQGYLVTEEFAGLLEDLRNRLEPYASSRAVFFREGEPLQTGTLFKQSGLAHTLRLIAERGPDVFYKGEIAREIARFYAEHEGLISYDDLASYEARWVEPISTTYRGYTFYSQPPNSSSVALLMQLNILEGYDLSSFEHNSARYLHLLGEVMRLAIADRNRYVADPEHTAVPIDRLLSKDYAARRRRLIDLEETMPVTTPGEPGEASSDHTTHLTVVDSAGNMVALTQTLGRWFGSGVVVGNTGVIFSNQLRHLHLDPESPSRLAPGRIPRSNQSPTIVLRDGRPFMAVGTPGSDGIWQRLVQVFANIIDFGMDIQDAISAPRMIYGGYQETGTEIPPVFIVEDRIPAESVRGLEAMGYEILGAVQDEGRVNGVMVDPATGHLLAGADPRSVVYAVGW